MSVKELHLCDICGKEVKVRKGDRVYTDRNQHIRLRVEPTSVKIKKATENPWSKDRYQLLNPFTAFSSNMFEDKAEESELELCNECLVKLLEKATQVLSLEGTNK